MNATNLNIVLTNSLCCISTQAVKVSKLYSIGDKCADSELQKLKLMNDWFEALRCYNANTSINSKFLLRTKLRNTLISSVAYRYELTINGVLYSAMGNGVSLMVDLLTSLFVQSPNIISVDFIQDPDTYDPCYLNIYVEATCDTTDIHYTVIDTFKNEVFIDTDWTLYQPGQCTVLNCLTETEFNTLVAKLMKECDICECQLNQ